MKTFRWGFTPLDDATRFGHNKVATILEEWIGNLERKKLKQDESNDIRYKLNGLVSQCNIMDDSRDNINHCNEEETHELTTDDTFK